MRCADRRGGDPARRLRRRAGRGVRRIPPYDGDTGPSRTGHPEILAHFPSLGDWLGRGLSGSRQGDQRRLCPVGRRYHLALYRPHCRNVSCPLAGGGKGGPWPGGVDRLRRLRPVSVFDAFLCAPCTSRDGDAELWLVQLLRRALGRQRGAAGADQLLHYDGAWAVRAAAEQSCGNAAADPVRLPAGDAADHAAVGPGRHLAAANPLRRNLPRDLGHRGGLHTGDRSHPV